MTERPFTPEHFPEHQDKMEALTKLQDLAHQLFPEMGLDNISFYISDSLPSFGQWEETRDGETIRRITLRTDLLEGSEAIFLGVAAHEIGHATMGHSRKVRPLTYNSLVSECEADHIAMILGQGSGFAEHLGNLLESPSFGSPAQRAFYSVMGDTHPLTEHRLALLSKEALADIHPESISFNADCTPVENERLNNYSLMRIGESGFRIVF